MAKQFACGDVVHGCKFTLTAENEAEVLAQVAAHAAAAHGLKEVTPELAAQVKAAIRQISTH
jgi:predicted small metal-binding protein